MQGLPSSLLRAVAADFFVNVTNTGSVDSDDVVLGFLVPPGAGIDGVPLQVRFCLQSVFARRQACSRLACRLCVT
jgi:hypothetical protein